MGLVVLDASILIAFVDPNHGHHEAVRRALSRRRRHDFVLPASAYAESLVDPHRRGPEIVRRLDRVVDDLPLGVEPLTRDIAREATALRAQHPAIKLPDALIIATGDFLAAREILTADHAWSHITPRARTIGD